MTTKQLTRRQQAERNKTASGKTTAAKEAPMEPGPPAPAPVAEPDKLDTVLAFLERLEQRVEGLESSSPSQFTAQVPERDPREHTANTYKPPSVQQLQATMIRSLNAAGQTVSRSIGPLENPAMLDKIPPKYHPIYRSGDLVRLNPEAPMHGSDMLLGTWMEDNETDGRGEIVRIQGLTKSYEPKYSVYIRGLTTRNGDGYLESQLMPT